MILEDEHSTFDDAAVGEETPYDADSRCQEEISHGRRLGPGMGSI